MAKRDEFEVCVIGTGAGGGDFILQLAESCLTPVLFRQILGRIERLAWYPT